MEKEKMQNIAEINLKSLFKILAKRKITFFIAFFIILIIGLTFTFLVSPEYSSTSQITLSDNEIFYNDALYKYFPGEADGLWIIPNTKESYQRVDYIIGKLDTIYSELKSDAILNNALNTIQSKITKTQLIKSINISVDRWGGIVTIENYARTPDLAYDLSKSVLDSYINQKKSELEKSYNVLLEKINAGLDVSQDDSEKYDALNITRNNMLDNKDLFIDRIKVVKPPELIDVKNTSSYLRNILLSLIAAIVIGIVTAFTVDYFKNPRN